MTTLNTSYHAQYKQALHDPTRLSEEDLLGLLLKYPYSQPLVFAYERRKKLIKQESPNKELALLYAQSESWLLSYVNKPIRSNEDVQHRPHFIPTIASNPVIQEEQTIPKEENIQAEVDLPVEEQEEILTQEEDINPITETEAEIHKEEVYIPSPEDSVEEGDSAEEPEQEISTEEDRLEEIAAEESSEKITVENETTEDASELDRLVQVGGITGNYFVFDSFERKENQIIEEEVSSTVEATEEKEDVSLYNDELMPYSFRWWLHKTRLEHADTYQPYAADNIALATPKSTINVGKIEESILDQQIKENIIHFQDPEEKLSEEVKRKPVVPVAPKKGSEIIEKFIQKDPIIQPPSPENINNENMARQSAEDNYILVTETLANIYIDQGLQLKAIEVFKKLILKYPEKKSYFATRIEKLEKNS